MRPLYGDNIDDVQQIKELIAENQRLSTEGTRLVADIASHERFGKEFMAENRRLCTVLRDIKNLSPSSTDHFDPFQTAKQMADMALDIVPFDDDDSASDKHVTKLRTDDVDDG